MVDVNHFLSGNITGICLETWLLQWLCSGLPSSCATNPPGEQIGQQKHFRLSKRLDRLHWLDDMQRCRISFIHFLRNEMGLKSC